jgi:hypothetical protein
MIGTVRNHISAMDSTNTAVVAKNVELATWRIPQDGPFVVTTSIDMSSTVVPQNVSRF